MGTTSGQVCLQCRQASGPDVHVNSSTDELHVWQACPAQMACQQVDVCGQEC